MVSVQVCHALNIGLLLPSLHSVGVSLTVTTLTVYHSSNWACWVYLPHQLGEGPDFCIHHLIVAMLWSLLCFLTVTLPVCRSLQPGVVHLSHRWCLMSWSCQCLVWTMAWHFLIINHVPVAKLGTAWEQVWQWRSVSTHPNRLMACLHASFSTCNIIIHRQLHCSIYIAFIKAAIVKSTHL